MNHEQLSHKALQKFTLCPALPYTTGEESPFPLSQPTSILTVSAVYSLKGVAWENFGNRTGLSMPEMAEGKDFRVLLSISSARRLMDSMSEDEKFLVRTGSLCGMKPELMEMAPRADFVGGCWEQRRSLDDPESYANAEFEDLVILLPKQDVPVFALRFLRRLHYTA